MAKKYEVAFDIEKQKWITVEEVDVADRYDKPRYFSIDTRIDNGGKILTFVRESKEIQFRKPELHPNIKTYRRSSYFREYCENNYTNKRELIRKNKNQESAVHKLAKEIVKEIKLIYVPELKTTIFGEDYIISDREAIEVKFKNIEKIDKDTGRIPDIILEANYKGTKQDIFVEIFYKHRVDQDKKEDFRKNYINCLEIDISELRNDLNINEKAIRKFIKNKIINESYWISNTYALLFNEEISKSVADISSNDKFLRNTYYNKSKAGRFFFFKDQYEIETGSKCSKKDGAKSTNIGECIQCSRCAYIENKNSNDVDNVHIYCSIRDDKKSNIIEIIKDAKDKATKNMKDMTNDL